MNLPYRETDRFEFQKLDVYKKSQQFYIQNKGLVKSGELDKYIQDQLLRASHSVVLNIAEGSGRSTSPDRKKFFIISRASVFECVAILDLLAIEGTIIKSEYDKSISTAEDISKMLYFMIRNLSIKK
jgi:four helix bundle protein